MRALDPTPSDLAFFSALMRFGSLSATGRELGVSTSAVSKRLRQLEQRLGVVLLTRSTRRITPTPEGARYLAQGRQILEQIEALESSLRPGSDAGLTGLLRINATPGFGRRHIAPLLPAFSALHPRLALQLNLSVDPPPLSEDAFDVAIRFGPPPPARVVAKPIAPNRRLLVAAPDYLARFGVPQQPEDLARHHCLCIRQGDAAYGLWTLSQGGDRRTVRVRGPLSTSDGAVAVAWALAGQGIVMRAEWDVAADLRAGRLLAVLPLWTTPPADIVAIYPQAQQHTPRVRAFVEFLRLAFADRQPGGSP